MNAWSVWRAAVHFAADTAPVILTGAYYTLAAGLAVHAWRRLKTRRRPRTAARRDLIEAAAIARLGDRLHTHPNDAIDGELDRHLVAYAATIQPLYRTEDHS